MPLPAATPGRVGYLLKKFPRLSETFVLGELLAQEALGRSLHVFSRRRADDEPRHPELARLRATTEVLPGARQIDPWNELFASANSDALIDRTGAIVRRAQTWEHDRFPSLLGEALHLLRRTQELGIDHLHVHFATDSAVTAHILHALGGPSYSITAHAKDVYRNTVRWPLTDALFTDARFVVTVCDANVRHLHSKVSAAAAGRVRRLYNGIDLTSFAFQPTSERDTDHVLSVGRLVAKKGFDVLLDAFARLLERRPAARLTLVGTGEDEADLRERARSLGPAVTMTGAVDQAGVRALMARASVFCLPCVIGEDGNRDALPTVLLEALATGLPCVSTPVTGIPEILDDGAAGTLVPQHDVDATAAALDRLLGDADERERLAQNGRVHAEANFDRRNAARVLDAWFSEATTGVPCTSPV